tara:strand:- start:600 stop:713 length:114 start_codon:yes stop_codon:yes gene_type:complete
MPLVVGVDRIKRDEPNRRVSKESAGLPEGDENAVEGN